MVTAIVTIIKKVKKMKLIMKEKGVVFIDADGDEA